MAGRVVVSTLNDDTGVLATQNGMRGIAKAWVFVSSSTSPSILGSFNVSSVTYANPGDFNVNFTTAMPNANYSSVVTNSGAALNPVYARSTSASVCRVVVNGGNNNDFSLAIFSS